MKYFLILFLLFSRELVKASTEDDKFVKKVNQILIKNPNNIDVIIKAGVYFYKKNNYRKAIWYWSSPKLASSSRYSIIKYYQSISHYRLGELQNAKIVLNQVDINKVTPRLRRQIINLTTRLYQKKSNPKSSTAVSLSHYQGQLSYAEDPQKNSGSLSGFYLMAFEDDIKIEAAFEKLTLEFNDNLGLEDYNQTDYSLLVTSFSDDLLSQTKYGIHVNEVDSLYAFSSKSILFGMGAFSMGGSYIGIDFSHNMFSATKNVNSFTATQISPGLKFRPVSWLYFSATMVFSRNTYVAESVESNNNLQSFEFGGGVDFKYFSLGATSSKGEEQFFLKNDGFLIQNSTDKTTISNSISLTIKLGDFSITGKHTINNYIKEGNNEEFQNESSLLFASINF